MVDAINNTNVNVNVNDNDNTNTKKHQQQREQIDVNSNNSHSSNNMTNNLTCLTASILRRVHAYLGALEQLVEKQAARRGEVISGLRRNMGRYGLRLGGLASYGSVRYPSHHTKSKHDAPKNSVTAHLHDAFRINY